MSSSYYSYYGNYPTSSSDIATLSGVLAGMMMTIITVSLIVYIIQVIAMWKIFTKAGEAGWKCLIPIYNLVIMFKISGLSPWLILLFLLGAIPVLGAIIIIALGAVLSYKLAKSFGKSGGFAVGLYFLAPIFYLILGFGSAQYVGPGGEAATTSNN